MAYYRRYYGNRRYRNYRRNKYRQNEEPLVGLLLTAIFSALGWLAYHLIRGLISLVNWAWKSIMGTKSHEKEYVFEPVEDIEPEKSGSTDSARQVHLENRPSEQIPTQSSRYFRKRSLLTPAEDNFYQVLDKIARENSYIIQSKVRLEGLVGVKFYAANWYGLRNRIKSREMDFVLCEKHNSSLDPLLVIELDDSSHLREDRVERDQNLDRVLHEAGLPILHVRAAYSYDASLLLQEIRGKISSQNVQI